MADINNDYYSPKDPPAQSSGPFLAKIVSHHDKTYMGILDVEILRDGAGNSSYAGQVVQAKYMSPFYGITKPSNTPTDPNKNNFTMQV